MVTRRGRRNKAVRTPCFLAWHLHEHIPAVAPAGASRRPPALGRTDSRRRRAGAGERGARAPRHRGRPDRRQRHGRAHRVRPAILPGRRARREARAAAARLGNAALRPLLAAPGPGLGPPARAVAARAGRPGGADRARGDADAAHRSGGLRQRLLAGAGSRAASGRGRAAQHAGARRLPRRRQRLRARRVRGARLDRGPVPDGARHAGAHRAVRRRDRDAAQLRSRDPALARAARAPAPAAGARVPVRRRGDRGIPPPLARAFRQRPPRLPRLPGRRAGHRAGRYRVLPAAVLRPVRHAVRLPPRAEPALHRGCRARRDRPGVGGGERPLPQPRLRHHPPAARARRGVPAAR